MNQIVLKYKIKILHKIFKAKEISNNNFVNIYINIIILINNKKILKIK